MTPDAPAGPERSLARLCVSACAESYSRLSLSTPLANALISETPAGHLLVAFRGSRSFRDWQTDFDVRRINLGFATVHHGFWDAAASVLDKILLLDQRAKRPPMMFTGHSLGAALAQVVAWRYARAGRAVHSVYTFGGPRVGDGRWARDYNQLLGSVTFRHVNQEDIVPRVPSWLAGWRHTRAEVFRPSLGASWQFKFPLWKKIISNAVGTYADWQHKKVAQLSDHNIQQYLDAL